MYSLSKFSIPTHGWSEPGVSMQVRLPRQEGDTRFAPRVDSHHTKVIMLVRVGNRLLTTSSGKFIEGSFGDGVTVADAAKTVLADTLGHVFVEKKSVLVGYFARGYAGEKPLPKHHLVLIDGDAFGVAGPPAGYGLVAPSSVEGIERSFLALVMALMPGDELGWGDPDKGEPTLMVWRRGRKLSPVVAEDKIAA